MDVELFHHTYFVHVHIIAYMYTHRSIRYVDIINYCNADHYAHQYHCYTQGIYHYINSRGWDGGGGYWDVVIYVLQCALLKYPI